MRAMNSVIKQIHKESVVHINNEILVSREKAKILSFGITSLTLKGHSAK